VVTRLSSLVVTRLSSPAREATRLNSPLDILLSSRPSRAIRRRAATARSGRTARPPVDIPLNQEGLHLRAPARLGPVLKVHRPRRAQ
jgi:hypothetical protein